MKKNTEFKEVDMLTDSDYCESLTP